MRSPGARVARKAAQDRHAQHCHARTLAEAQPPSGVSFHRPWHPELRNILAPAPASRPRGPTGHESRIHYRVLAVSEERCHECCVRRTDWESARCPRSGCPALGQPSGAGLREDLREDAPFDEVVKVQMHSANIRCVRSPGCRGQSMPEWARSRLPLTITRIDMQHSRRRPMGRHQTS